MPDVKPGRSPASRPTVVDQLAAIEAEGGDGVLALPGGVALALSNLGKVFFPDDGVTKGDLLRYYAAAAPHLLPIVAGRPLVLRRFPNGIAGRAFYQHEVADPPTGVRTALVALDAVEPPRRYLVGDDPVRGPGPALATLLHAVQLGAVSVDPFHTTHDALGTADYTVIDLDPGPQAPFARVVAVAQWVKAELDALGLRAALKTSGSRGLHVVLPLPPRTTAETALLLAQLVATRVAAAHPREATVERTVRVRRADAVYVDYLQNIPGKTVAAAYAARARPGATVSTPLRGDVRGPGGSITKVPRPGQPMGGTTGTARRAPGGNRRVAWACRRRTRGVSPRATHLGVLMLPRRLAAASVAASAAFATTPARAQNPVRESATHVLFGAGTDFAGGAPAHDVFPLAMGAETASPTVRSRALFGSPLGIVRTSGFSCVAPL